MAEAKKSLRITQVRSSIGRPADQGKTLRALGLGKIGRTVDQVDNESVRGMIFKVKHLVEGSSSPASPAGAFDEMECPKSSGHSIPFRI